MIDYNELFEYIDGKLFWKVDAATNVKAGAEAGHVHSTGYVHITIDGKLLKRHRIIYEMFHGSIHDGYEIDHINDMPGDDRIENLQLLTHQQNTAKIRVSNNTNRNNTSGHRGVCWHKATGKWQAKISVSGKYIHLGVFSDISDACAARESAEKEYHYTGCK